MLNAASLIAFARRYDVANIKCKLDECDFQSDCGCEGLLHEHVQAGVLRDTDSGSRFRVDRRCEHIREGKSAVFSASSAEIKLSI